MSSQRSSSTSPEKPDTGPLLGALLRRCHQAMLVEIARGLTDAGYPEFQPPHGAVLRPLWDRPHGMRSTDLAATARITKQSMGSIVDQLEQLGYAERVDDPQDKRAKLVRLTKQGRDAGRVTRAVVRSVEADWGRRIGSAKVTELRDTLRQLLASLEMDA